MYTIGEINTKWSGKYLSWYISWSWSQYLIFGFHCAAFLWGFSIIKGFIRFVVTEEILQWYNRTLNNTTEYHNSITYVLKYHIGSIIASSILIPLAYPITILGEQFWRLLIKLRIWKLNTFANFLNILNAQSISGTVTSRNSFIYGASVALEVQKDFHVTFSDHLMLISTLNN